MTSKEIAAKYTFKENDADNETTKEQREKFFDLLDAFGRARPTRLARRQRDLSTKFPVHFLNATKRQFRKPIEKPIWLPDNLQRLVDAQDPNGIWQATPQVLGILGGDLGATPDPPDGVSAWRWTTVLCCVFIQRHPDHFAGLRKAYKLAEKWNEDTHLEAAARHRLPPVPCYFYIDPNMIRQGKWKEGPNPSVPQDRFARGDLAGCWGVQLDGWRIVG